MWRSYIRNSILALCGRFICILAAVFALQGCNKHADGFGDYADSVSVSAMDNALRATIYVNYKKDCSCFIKYWKREEEEAAAKTTKVASVGPGRHTSVLKFLSPDTHYSFRVIVEGAEASKKVDFTTISLPPDLPRYSVELSDDSIILDGALLQWDAALPGYVTLCDFDGEIIWYQAYGQGIRTARFDERSGRIAIMSGFKYGEDSDKFYRVADELLVSDLDGNILFRRKSSAGFVENPHHEFCFTPDGNLLIVGNVVKNYDLSSIEGGSEGTPLWGDGFFVADYAGNILKSWDCFRGIDPLRAGYVNPVKFAEDYLHANSVTVDSGGITI